MTEIKFAWDKVKAEANWRTHGVSFEEASTVFGDENARFKHDREHSRDEERFIILGFSAKLRLLLVCHAYRENEQTIRIISARKASRKERAQYGSFL